MKSFSRQLKSFSGGFSVIFQRLQSLFSTTSVKKPFRECKNICIPTIICHYNSISAQKCQAFALRCIAPLMTRPRDFFHFSKNAILPSPHFTSKPFSGNVKSRRVSNFNLLLLYIYKYRQLRA